MIYLFLSIAFVLLFWGTWIFYLAIMNLKRVKELHGLTGAAYVFGIPTLAIGLVMDWTLNVFLTLFFLDIPRTPGELVTGRLKRYAYGSNGWRKNVAIWLTNGLLDDYDPSGKHV